MAATKKKQGLGNDEVLTLVDAMRKDCVGWDGSTLSTEREKVQKYYDGELPVQQHKGSSTYRASDVYDSVEAIKTQVLETFAGNGEDIISFPPQHDQDAEAARDATAWCAYVVHRQNDFETFGHDAVHDGLTARIGVVKVYWEDDHEDEEFSADGLTEEETYALASQEDYAEVDLEQDPTTGLFSGKLTKRKDTSRICIDAVPLEEFGVSSRAGRDLEKADAVIHRPLKTRDELIRMYPKHKKALEEAASEAGEVSDSPESLQRFAASDAISGGTGAHQPEADKLTFYEAYVMLDLKNGKGLCRYKVCYVSGLMLSDEPEEVSRLPFKVFVPLPVPHTLWGNNFGARVIPTQNARTVLTRGVLDHTAITTNPRWLVLKGGLLNPKEMIDNRLGGIVNTNRPDAVTALQYGNLNPFVFEVLKMLKDNKEESTGVSSLSQGMNKDAVSSQNSGALIDNLVNLSQQRQKIIARNFAKFLVDIYLEVYQLTLEHVKEEKVVEIADGTWERFDPSQWEARTKCRVSVNLGYGEKQRKATQYASAYEKLAADPILGPVFGIKKRIKLAIDTMRLSGFDNPAEYFDNPDEIQPPGPDPLKLKELQIEEMKAKAALITAEATAKAKDTDSVVKMLAAKLDQITQNFQMALDKRESDRMDIETASRVDVARREIKLAEEAPAESTNTIVSANG